MRAPARSFRELVTRRYLAGRQPGHIAVALGLPVELVREWLAADCPGKPVGIPKQLDKAGRDLGAPDEAIPQQAALVRPLAGTGQRPPKHYLPQDRHVKPAPALAPLRLYYDDPEAKRDHGSPEQLGLPEPNRSLMGCSMDR